MSLLALRLASCFLISQKYLLDMLEAVNIVMSVYTNCEHKNILFRWGVREDQGFTSWINVFRIYYWAWFCFHSHHIIQGNHSGWKNRIMSCTFLEGLQCILQRQKTNILKLIFNLFLRNILSLGNLAIKFQDSCPGWQTYQKITLGGTSWDISITTTDLHSFSLIY